MEEITEPEIMYRAVKRSRPDTLTPDGKRVLSALFKDENGVSVDCRKGRTEAEAIDRLKSFFHTRLKAVGSLSGNCVAEAGACVISDASEKNPYHALIYKNSCRESLTALQALKLADGCSLVYIDKTVKWLE